MEGGASQAMITDVRGRSGSHSGLSSYLDASPEGEAPVLVMAARLCYRMRVTNKVGRYGILSEADGIDAVNSDTEADEMGCVQ